MQTSDIERFSQRLARVLEGRGQARDLIDAVSALFPCEAAFAVLNPCAARPIYLADSYPEGPSKAAVQLYVKTTYELNPVYNAVQQGLFSGVYRMADLAPDDWQATTAEVVADRREEIGFRTPGWPAGMQEVSVLVDLEDGLVGEISLARPAVAEGVPEADLEGLRVFLPLIRAAFLKLRSDISETELPPHAPPPTLGQFGEGVLSSREAEVLQLILKGHSSLSIALELQIAVPTVKSHRRNAYAKLGISTQQQLFRAYLDWRGA